MSRRYHKSDIQTHYDYGRSHPAFNVKVYKTISETLARQVATDMGYDADRFVGWLEQTYGDSDGSWEYAEGLYPWHDAACQDESEYFIDYLSELLPDWNGKAWHEGRSGGWIVVDGLPDVESWDAIQVARWGKAERIAREIADSIPYQMLSLVIANEYDEYVRATDADKASSYVVGSGH